MPAIRVLIMSSEGVSASFRGSILSWQAYLGNTWMSSCSTDNAMKGQLQPRHNLLGIYRSHQSMPLL